MKGQIYKIHNPTNKNTYIGSTIQKYAKKRLYRHKKLSQNCHRYGCLFDNDTEFSVLAKIEINKISELRELEQVFIKIAENSVDICINKNMSYVPEHLKKLRINEQKVKYNHSDKGKEARKWQNYRHIKRKKINEAILKYWTGVPGKN
tara:strand:+ start:1077 stop:1520 length:444 start_codon:yes stop_codon:yes gene_type:complete